MSQPIIKTQKELSAFIKDKKILHLNSLGKDSILCLEWLTLAARPSKIVSVFFGFIANNPDDQRYLNYLKNRYKNVEFIVESNSFEVTDILQGVYQHPTDALDFENYYYNDFNLDKIINDLMTKYECDYSCSGMAKYESFTRAAIFHRKGLCYNKKIYPIGMFSKQNVLDMLKKTGVKLHPQYKIVPSTIDHPSYYKMRDAMRLSKEYKKIILETYPLITLDQYRYEVLFNNGKK